MSADRGDWARAANAEAARARYSTPSGANRCRASDPAALPSTPSATEAALSFCYRLLLTLWRRAISRFARRGDDLVIRGKPLARDEICCLHIGSDSPAHN